MVETQQGNIALVKSGFAAFAAGDMSTLAGFFAPDAVWRSAAIGALSGIYTGPEEIIAYFRHLHALSGGSVSNEILALAAGGDHVFVLERTTARRQSNAFDDRMVLVMRIVEGKVREVEAFQSAVNWNDEFWS